MIEFNCSQCGHHIRVPENGAGKRGKCKVCGALLRIPEAPNKSHKDANSAAQTDIEDTERPQNQLLKLVKEPQIILSSFFVVGIVLVAIFMAVTKETPEEVRRRTLEEYRKQDEPFLRRIQKEKEEKLESLDRRAEEMKKMVENISENNQKLIEEQYRKNMQEIDRKAKNDNERLKRDFQKNFSQ